MPDLLAQFPRDLAQRVRLVRLGDGVPALLAHPDWERPAPFVLWMHGRTASKELDPGRYLRLVRAGIGAVAIDLPGHGERYEALLQEPTRSLEVIEKAASEIDAVVASLRDPALRSCFDLSRAGVGGMSMGGMVSLLRLCSPHPAALPRGFRALSLEATTGWLEGLYFPQRAGLPATRRWVVDHAESDVLRVDPAAHLAGFTPLPVLAAHSEADEIVPWEVQRGFLERLRAHYAARGADPASIEVMTFPSTGAPQEHVGFGKFSNETKNAQTAFFARTLA